MTYSFAIRDGDLDLRSNGPGFAPVRGAEKLMQDLRCALMEQRGTDPMHPDYGSTLDGGIGSDGTVVDTFIGGTITGESVANIEAEVIRVLQAYQRQQINAIDQQQQNFGGKTYFSNKEILYKLNGVESRQIDDTIVVKVSITTAAGQILDIVQPVGKV